MPTANAAASGTLTARPGASRRLLQAKAAASCNTPTPPLSEALEESFPAAGDDRTPAACTVGVGAAAGLAAVESAADLAPEPPLASPALQPVSASTWSEADERAYQELTARRRASGYQRRGRDVGGQLLRGGRIAPNPGTVAAAIVALVAERDVVTRADLLAVMAGDMFSHPKAKGGNQRWAQGYIAGLVRDGFLVAEGEAVADARTEDRESEQ